MAPDQWRRAWPQGKQLPEAPPQPTTLLRGSPRRPPGHSPRARAPAPAPEEYILAPEEYILAPEEYILAPEERGIDIGCPSRPQSATSSQAQP